MKAYPRNRDILAVILMAGTGACDARPPLDPQATDHSITRAVNPKDGGTGGVGGTQGAPAIGSGGTPDAGVGGTPGTGIGGTGGGGFPTGCPCSRAPGRQDPPTGWSCPAGRGVSAMAVIGPEGGTLSLVTGNQGVTLELTIPAGALSAPTAIKVTESAGPTPTGYTDYTPLYEFEPFGLKLAEPARVRVPWSIALSSGATFNVHPALAAYLLASSTGNFERLADSYTNAGFTQASLARLGNLFAGYPATLDPQSCNFPLTCESSGLFVPIPNAVRGGRCSIVGTWDATSPQSGSNPPSQASFIFNADGTWIGGLYKEDVSATQFMRGVFRADETTFEILSSQGMGCPCSYGAGFKTSFDDACSSLTLTHSYDNCTGGRKYLMPLVSTLRRR